MQEEDMYTTVIKRGGLPLRSVRPILDLARNIKIVR